MTTGSIFDSLMNYSAGDTEEQTAAKVARQAEINDMSPSERFLARLEEDGYDMSGMGPILKTRGNQQIVSCAGSGKTTTLINKLLYDHATGEVTTPREINGQIYRIVDKIWVSTFLKTGANELGDVFYKKSREYGIAVSRSQVKFSTLDAEFFNVLTTLGISVDIIDGKANTELLRDVLSLLQVGGNGRLNAETMRSIESALNFSRNRIGESRYEHPAYAEYGIGTHVVDTIIREWQRKRQYKGMMDHGDVQDHLYNFAVVAKEQQVIDLIANRYKFMYVDEFQDTSEVQYEILKVYMKHAKKVIVIGDDDQTIYTWRGSSNKIIVEDFANDFDAVRQNLEVNYRCPSNILDPVVPSIERNSQRLEKSIRSHKEGGEMRLMTALTYKDMTALLQQGIAQDVAEGMSVAVVCRNNIDGLIPAMLLDKFSDGLQFSISGDRMTLDSHAGRQVLSIVNLFTSRSNARVEAALNQLTFNRTQVRNMVNHFKSSKDSIWNVDMNDVRHSLPDVAQYLERWRKVREESGGLAALWYVLEEYKHNVYKKPSNYNDIIKSIIDAVLALIEGGDYDTPAEVLYDLEDINERLKARKKMDKVGVRIATVHEFKGKEADSVYVWNDSEGAFPSGNINNLTHEEFEEERRVHYIACTRALKRSTIIYRSGAAGVFLSEMNLENATKINTGMLNGRL